MCVILLRNASSNVGIPNFMPYLTNVCPLILMLLNLKISRLRCFRNLVWRITIGFKNCMVEGGCGLWLMFVGTIILLGLGPHQVVNHYIVTLEVTKCKDNLNL